MPDWAKRAAPAVATRAIPLVPSRLAPLETDEEDAESLAREDAPSPLMGEGRGGRDSRTAVGSPPTPSPSSQGRGENPLADPPVLAPAVLADGNRFLRGTLTHALLEHLPSFERSSWPAVAEAFIARRAATLASKARAGIIAETLAILTDPKFAPYFGPSSRAEVPIVAEIPSPNGKGPPLRIIGQIDRIAIIEGKGGTQALIIDYKTNRPPPHDPAKVARSYLLQLAAYRLAVRASFAAKTVRAAILWTDGPRIMEMPSSLLDSFESELWRLDQMNVHDGSSFV